MFDNFDHYISKNIKSIYKRKLFSPIIYLIILTALLLYFPVSSIVFPPELSSSDSLSTAYSDQPYVRTILNDLKFTGYTRTSLGQTTGYYYYTMRGGECTIVLLSPRTSEEGLPSIPELTIHARVENGNTDFHELLTNISADLNWTKSGISSKVSSFYLSEPGFRWVPSVLLIVVMLLTGAYALVSLIMYILYIIFPVLSPPCQQLGLYGRPAKMLAQAEEELATLPQLATEDMFITEHYFIVISSRQIAIIPISEIIWIYKYSTLHKFFWYHFSISYTLHIAANKHFYLQCPKNLKSDIDGVMDYLAEANHSILTGFNEENRLKVQEIQGRPLQFDRLVSLLKKRI